MLPTKDPFILTMAYATASAFLGAIGGFVMAFFITAVVSLVSTDPTFTEAVHMGGPIWIAMGFGSAVGAVLGGIAGLREAERK